MPSGSRRDGKEVKFLCVGKKGYDALRRIFARQILDVIELRGIKQIGFGDADAIGKRVLSLFAEGQFDVATLFYAEFKSVIAQIPTARQLIPAQITGEAAARAAVPSTNTSRTKRRSSPTCCRATCRSRSSGRCSRTPPPNRAPR